MAFGGSHCALCSRMTFALCMETNEHMVEVVGELDIIAVAMLGKR